MRKLVPTMLSTGVTPIDDVALCEVVGGVAVTVIVTAPDCDKVVIELAVVALDVFKTPRLQVAVVEVVVHVPAPEPDPAANVAELMVAFVPDGTLAVKSPPVTGSPVL